MTSVLVVDDEPQLRRALEINLRIRDYHVKLAATGAAALRIAASMHPDVVILDLGLPDIDGIEVVEGLRGWTDVPIVVLSARNAEADKVSALDAGADDYVTKPFGIEELLARMRAALRRRGSHSETEPVVVTDSFTVDLVAKRVTVPDGEVRLTPIEWQIVDTLVRHADRLVTHGQLREAVWGTAHHRDTNLLRVHLANIRRKLEPDPSRPRYFLTEPGMGHRFTSTAAPARGSARPGR